MKIILHDGAAVKAKGARGWFAWQHDWPGFPEGALCHMKYPASDDSEILISENTMVADGFACSVVSFRSDRRD